MPEEKLKAVPRRRRWRWPKRLGIALAGFVALYSAFLLLGFVPVNSRAVTADTEYVRLYVRSNEIHTDLVLPVVCDDPEIDWREVFPPQHFASNVVAMHYVAVGWGNRRFFVETQRWSDLKCSTAVGAVLPSESVLHVEYLPDAGPGPWLREVHVTREQYRRLAAFVRDSIGEVDEYGYAITATDLSYNSRDRFYISSGAYHLFNNCNQWTGRGLKRAGLPTGIWTPLRQQVDCWLPETRSTALVSTQYCQHPAFCGLTLASRMDVCSSAAFRGSFTGAVCEAGAGAQRSVAVGGQWDSWRARREHGAGGGASGLSILP